MDKQPPDSISGRATLSTAAQIGGPVCASRPRVYMGPERRPDRRLAGLQAGEIGRRHVGGTAPE